MTFEEFIAQMAAAQGRQNRGQANVTTAQRAELEEILRQQFPSIGPISHSRVNDPGGMGSWWEAQATNDPGLRFLDPVWEYGNLPTADEHGTIDPAVARQRFEEANDPAYYQSYLGQVHDSDEGNYYRIYNQFNPDGSFRGVDYRQFTPEGGWLADNLPLVAGLTIGGMGLASALGVGAGAGAAAAGMTPAEALAAGVAPAPVGGGSMAGVVGGTAAAAGGAAGLGGLAGGAATVGSLLSNPAVIGGGLSLIGGALGADAARDAARAQEASANAAIEEIRRQYDQNRADQMPWLEAGRTSLADLMARMGDLTTPYTQADFQNDPGYQFELAEGQRALDAAARARGLYGSTGALRELLRYSQGLASTRYQDAWNRDLTNRQNAYNMLSGISGTGQVTAGNLGSMGQGTANTVGDLLTQTGNAQAAGRIGAANAWTNAGSQALNAWQQQMLLNRIGSNLYR